MDSNTNYNYILKKIKFFMPINLKVADYIPFYIYIQKINFKINLNYCNKYPFLNHYRPIYMDTLEKRNIKMIYGYALFPIVLFYDYKQTYDPMYKNHRDEYEKTTKLKQKSIAHLIAIKSFTSFIFPMLTIAVLTKKYNTDSIKLSKNLAKSKRAFQLALILPYMVATKVSNILVEIFANQIDQASDLIIAKYQDKENQPVAV